MIFGGVQQYQIPNQNTHFLMAKRD